MDLFASDSSDIESADDCESDASGLEVPPLSRDRSGSCQTPPLMAPPTSSSDTDDTILEALIEDMASSSSDTDGSTNVCSPLVLSL